MRINLTVKQRQALQPLRDRVKAAAHTGYPGMLVAQICYNQEGDCWLEPGFLDHEHAKLITEKGQP